MTTWPFALSWLTLLLPLLGALASFIAETPRRAAQICVSFTGLAFLMSIVVLGYRVLHHQGSADPYESVITFFNMQNTDTTLFPNIIQAEVGVHVDNLSTLFATLITCLGTAAQMHAAVVLRGDAGYRRFFWVACLLVGGLLAVDFSGSLFQTWLGAGLMTLATLLLGLHWWQREGAGDAARRGYITLLAADLGLLFALVFNLAKFGLAPTASGQTSLDPYSYTLLDGFWLATGAGHMANAGTRTLTVMALVFIAVILVRAAQLPFTGWLSGLREAPLPALGLLGGAALLAGPLVAEQVYPLFLVAPHTLSVLALAAAASAALLGAGALFSDDIYRVGLLSAAAQAGLALAAMGAGGYSDGLFAAFGAAPTALLLFVVAGNLVRVYRTRLVSEMGGAFSRVRRTATGLLVWAVAVAGANLGGYHVLAAVFRNRSPRPTVELGATTRVVVAVLVILSLALLALAGFRVLARVAMGEPVRRRGFDVQRMAEVEPRLRRVLWLAVAATVLTALCGIPGLSGFSAGKTYVSGLTFSHWVFFGPIRQQLPVDGTALAVAAAVLVVAAVAGRVGLGRLDVGAAVGGVTRLPWSRVTRPIVAFTTVGIGVLETADSAVLGPLVDAPADGLTATASLSRRLRSTRIGVAAGAAALVIVVLAGASVLAASGHLPVHTR
jgi:NADH:ubiquinone oxidoreductase subunit 5 (subunit L)/multisubunit Na+/H+ antiporter MnhA subunit